VAGAFSEALGLDGIHWLVHLAGTLRAPPVRDNETARSRSGWQPPRARSRAESTVCSHVCCGARCAV